MTRIRRCIDIRNSIGPNYSIVVVPLILIVILWNLFDGKKRPWWRFTRLFIASANGIFSNGNLRHVRG